MLSDDLVPRLGARADRIKSWPIKMADWEVFTYFCRSGCIHDPWQDRRPPRSLPRLLAPQLHARRAAPRRAALPGREASYSMAPQLHKPSSPRSHFYQHENGLAGFGLFCFVTCLNVVTLCFLTARISSDTKTVSHLFITNSSSVGRTGSFQRSPCWSYSGNRPYLSGAGMDTGGK